MPVKKSKKPAKKAPVKKTTKKTTKKSTAKKKSVAKKTTKKVAPKKVKKVSEPVVVVETFVKQDLVEAVVDSNGVVTMTPVKIVQ